MFFERIVEGGGMLPDVCCNRWFTHEVIRSNLPWEHRLGVLLPKLVRLVQACLAAQQLQLAFRNGLQKLWWMAQDRRGVSNEFSRRRGVGSAEASKLGTVAQPVKQSHPSAFRTIHPYGGRCRGKISPEERGPNFHDNENN